MNSGQPPRQSLIGLLWETLRLSMRLLWRSSVVRPALERQQALAVLGLPPEATAQQIKQRYRRLAKKYHPDLGGDPRQMQRIVAAYELLMKEQPIR
ncbi:MAG TPA: J domain-containing protein [Ktedonobacteraceae bacterium]|jgi:DnaJ-domain-containing protein 1